MLSFFYYSQLTKTHVFQISANPNVLFGVLETPASQLEKHCLPWYFMNSANLMTIVHKYDF